MCRRGGGGGGVQKMYSSGYEGQWTPCLGDHPLSCLLGVHSLCSSPLSGSEALLMSGGRDKMEVYNVQ